MKKYLTFIVLSLPVFAFAQGGIKNINDVATKATSIGDLAIGLAIALAVVWIIVGVVRYLIMGSDAEGRKAAGWNILFGVVGLFVILSIWGLVAVLTGTFKFADNQKPSFENIMLSKPSNTINNDNFDKSQMFDAPGNKPGIWNDDPQITT